MTETATTPTSRTHLVSDPHGVRYAPDSPDRVGKIVVAIDGSDSSPAVLTRGIRIATALHTSLELVTTWSFPDYYGLAAPDPDHSAQNDAKQILAAAAAAEFHGKNPEWVTLIPLEGRTADTLIEASRGAEMLIVGSRGHSGIAGLLLGSVSSECAERATCPVLVVH